MSNYQVPDNMGAPDTRKFSEPDPWETCCACGEDIQDTVTGDWLDEAMAAYSRGGDCICGVCSVKAHHSVALLAIARMTGENAKLKTDLSATENDLAAALLTRKRNQADHDRIEKLERMARAYCKWQKLELKICVYTDGEVLVSGVENGQPDLRTAIDSATERQYPE